MDGGADGIIIDPGAPMEHTREVPAAPVTPTTQAPQQTDTEKRLAAVERELSESRSTEAYWRGRADTAAPAADEPEEEAAPDNIPDTPADEPVDDLLNDLNANGLKALQKRGVITGPQLKQILEQRDARIVQTYQADQEGKDFDTRLAKEFPEIVEDAARVAKKQAPKTELYNLTAENFKQLISDAPGVKAGSVAGRGLMLAAARMAKSTLAGREQSVDNRERDRRDRIDSQPGGGRRAGGPDTGGQHESELSPITRSVISALSGHGVTEEKFRSFGGGEGPQRRNGRG